MLFVICFSVLEKCPNKEFMDSIFCATLARIVLVAPGIVFYHYTRCDDYSEYGRTYQLRLSIDLYC